jgi:outer membrane protein OmpA-like peptidoglycan-associated protein
MKTHSLLLAVAAALALAGCQSTPPKAPPPLTATQLKTQPPVPVAPPEVASAGPLATAGVGRYMDALERDLRLRLRGSGIVVARRGDDMLVTLPNPRLFVREAIAPAGQSLLEDLALVLRRYDRTQLQVNGYTDTVGSVEQNLTVSLKRAGLVGEALARYGVAVPRIEVHGFGEAYLKIVTQDQVSEPRNRRIEIRIVPRPG